MSKRPGSGVAGGRPIQESERDWLGLLDQMIERRRLLTTELELLEQRIVLVSHALVLEMRGHKGREAK